MFNRKILLLFVLLFSVLALMVFQSTRKPLTGGEALQSPVLWIEKNLNSLRTKIIGTFRSYKKLKEENLKLKKENQKLKLMLTQLEEMLLEKERVKELDRLRKQYSRVVTVARVISMGISPWPKMMIIDKGSKQGIKKDMAVVSVDGLVGKVFQVMKSYSKVLILTDVNFSTSVRIKESRTEGVLSGTGTGVCVLKYIPKDEEIKEGMTIITSGLDGLFPKGIPVGVISRIEGTDELFYSIKVSPFVRLNKLEEVMVLGKNR
ncbi:MAG: rod shape-determining protein MreC [Nitrospirae bacterium]|nr:rod shape-determining protein MreC [Nitrospirota bacterium]